MNIPDLQSIISVVFFLGLVWVCLYILTVFLHVSLATLAGDFEYVKENIRGIFKTGITATTAIMIGTFLIVFFFAYIPFIATKGL